MNRKRACHQQNGVALLEVLITMLVTGLALVSLLQSNMFSLVNSHSAQLRFQSSVLAGDMMDRLRSDMDAARDGDYDIAFGAAPAAGTDILAINRTTWFARIGNLLPSGIGQIDCTTIVDTCTVGVQWDDSRGESGSSTQQFLITSRLR